jgi:hypothetical protein
MKKMVLLLLWIVWTAAPSVHAQATRARQQSFEHLLPGIWGEATNGLQPYVDADKEGTEWHVEIDFYARTNFPKNAWLKTTNRLGSTLVLVLPDGTEINSTNPFAAGVDQFPSQTTVSNIWQKVPHFERIHLWLPLSLDAAVPGDSGAAANFALWGAFPFPITNDVVLKVTPLLYRIDSDIQTAHLVTFPTISMSLLTNGTVKAVGKPVGPPGQ